MDNANLCTHCYSLLNLAETIDMIFLNTICPEKGESDPGVNWGLSLRPLDMPKHDMEPTNRALPTNQPIRRNTGCLTLWTSDEARKFIEILKNCEFQVYRAGRIHWDFTQEKLRKQGVDKFHVHLKALHSAPAADPTCDVLGARAMGFKHRWKEIYQIKRCLESLKLIRPPKDGKDDRHHIPGLEDGFQTFMELKALVLGGITLSKDDLPVRTEC